MKLFRTAAVAVLALAVALVGSGPATAVPQAKILTAVSLTAPASGPYGSTIKLSGKLWRYSTATGVNYATVQLQRSVHNKKVWSTYKTAKTNADGTFAFSVVQSGAYDYRTYFAGSPVYTAALGPVRYPVTSQKVLLDTITTTNNTTGAMRATGRVYPAPLTGTIVYLQHWVVSARQWQTVGSGRTSGNAVTISLTRPASLMSYRLVVAARYPYGAGVSATRGFGNYVWRSMPSAIIFTGGHGASDFNHPYEMWMRVNASSYEYWNVLDTARCKRIEGDLGADSMNSSPLYVDFATGRPLVDTIVNPGAHDMPYGLNLMSNEHELTIRARKSSPNDETLVVGLRALCSN